MEQRLSFLGLTGEKSADGHLLAEYICTCGGKVITYRSRVKNGYTRSCGCMVRENGIKHGYRGTDTYTSWCAMRRRCLVSSDKDFPRYGGRGVTICDQWGEFQNFLADMGDRPRGTTLDRIDPEGNYSPDNCRWATASEQQRNRRDSVEWVVKGIKFPTLLEAATHFGVTEQTIVRWVRGSFDPRRDTFTPALEDCHVAERR